MTTYDIRRLSILSPLFLQLITLIEKVEWDMSSTKGSESSVHGAILLTNP
jgi:hypothetical protein